MPGIRPNACFTIAATLLPLTGEANSEMNETLDVGASRARMAIISETIPLRMTRPPRLCPTRCKALSC